MMYFIEERTSLLRG